MRALKSLKLGPNNNQEGVAAANAFLNGKPMPHVNTVDGASEDRGPSPECLFDFSRKPQDSVTDKDLESSELIFKDGKFSQVRSVKLSRAEGQFADKGPAPSSSPGAPTPARQSVIPLRTPPAQRPSPPLRAPCRKTTSQLPRPRPP